MLSDGKKYGGDTLRTAIVDIVYGLIQATRHLIVQLLPQGTRLLKREIEPGLIDAPPFADIVLEERGSLLRHKASPQSTQGHGRELIADFRGLDGEAIVKPHGRALHTQGRMSHHGGESVAGCHRDVRGKDIGRQRW